MQTVRDVTCQLLREFGLTTIFGNLGSTEETFLKNFPSDFRYVLALQEASVIGMAANQLLVNSSTTVSCAPGGY